MAAVSSGVQLNLGFLTVLVNVETAVQAEEATSFNTICNIGHDPVRTKQNLFCPTCDNSDRSTFVKGKELDDGRIVIVDAETIKGTAPDATAKKRMELTTHPVDEVNQHTLPLGKVYYLTPGKGTTEAYPLMVALIKARPEVAFCTVWTPRSKSSMYRLGVYGEVLTITELAWPANVKAVVKPDIELNPAMVPLAEQFVDQLMAPFDPTTYVDKRAETLAAFIASAEGLAPGEAPTTAAPAAPSLLDALQAAVAQSTAPKKKAPSRKKKSA